MDLASSSILGRSCGPTGPAPRGGRRAMITDKPYAEVRRRFASDPEKVFAAFAKAELVSRWLTPSPEIRLSVLEFDFREGGSYRFAYHIPGAVAVIVAGS